MLHVRCLSDLLGDEFAVHRLKSSSRAGLRGAMTVLAGAIDWVSAASVRTMLTRIAEGGIHQLWLDEWNVGRLAAAVKRAATDVTATTFAHNVEARFFLGSLRHRPRPCELTVVIANCAANRMAVRHSHRLVELSERDLALFGQLYRRRATGLLPMAIDDRLAATPAAGRAMGGLLFVGRPLYANLSADQPIDATIAAALADPRQAAPRRSSCLASRLPAQRAQAAVLPRQRPCRARHDRRARSLRNPGPARLSRLGDAPVAVGQAGDRIA